MNLIKEEIQLPDRFSVTAEAEDFRNELALQAVNVIAIQTAAQNDHAGAVVREMRSHIKEVEAMRVELTKPLRVGQQLLKSLADDHNGPLLEQIGRIERMGTIYALAELRRVEAEESARAKEIARLEQERLDALALANASLGTRDEVAAESLAEQTETAIQVAICAPLPEVNRSRGQVVRQVLRYDVEDIRAVYAARPELCNLEIKPSAVNATCVPEMPVPGMRLWWETKTTFSTR